MMLLVAGSAIALALAIHPDDRPGVYATLGRYGIGVSRVDWLGPSLLEDGRPGGWEYVAGVWDRRPYTKPVAGVFCRDGRFWLGSGDWRMLL